MSEQSTTNSPNGLKSAGADVPDFPDNFRIDPELLEVVPEHFARKHSAFPLRGEDGSIVMAVPKGVKPDALDCVKFHSGRTTEFIPVSPQTVTALIENNYAKPTNLTSPDGGFASDAIQRIIDEVSLSSQSEDGRQSVTDFSQSSPVVKLTNSIIEEAFFKRASDIHLEPYENELRVRYRIDGVLYVFHRLPIRIAPVLTSRLKVMCELNIVEKRLTQQGRMDFQTSHGKSFECRISVVPVIFGEKVAIRILDSKPLHFSLSQLGFESTQLADFERALRVENGMVLIAGPTGSGKTTTLYSVLEEIKSDNINIITAEDPIEYNISGINQVQVREDIGLTFSECLRSFLRQDPDVILVGEIRDSQTAEIAVKASLTGHLMLSTIHTGDSLSSIVRLLDMGIEPFLVASSLRAVVSQRLVRVICDSCKQNAEIAAAVLRAAEIPEEDCRPDSVCEGAGCPACSEIGYRGREAVYEVVVVNSELREMIVSGASTGEMREWAARGGLKTMRQNAIEKLSRGITTLEEVLKNVPYDGGE